MQDRSPQLDETSCHARPDHTFGSFWIESAGFGVWSTSASPRPRTFDGWVVPGRGHAGGEGIHSDFERDFIRAETIVYDDSVANGGEAGARDAGKLRLEGKRYVVADGDVMHFRFAT